LRKRLFKSLDIAVHPLLRVFLRSPAGDFLGATQLERECSFAGATIFGARESEAGSMTISSNSPVLDNWRIFRSLLIRDSLHPIIFN
jgi:hypothetical protein